LDAKTLAKSSTTAKNFFEEAKQFSKEAREAENYLQCSG